MKRMIALLLVPVLALSGCGIRKEQQKVEPTTAIQTLAPTAPTTEPATEPTTKPTTEPTTEPAPVYRNPLNGEILEEPFTGRIFANTISNIPDALPHVGVNQADILLEMFVNGSIIRCLALYTDIESVSAIGSTRSTRLMFNDIVQHYSAILSDAGGDKRVLRDAKERGIIHYNVDSLMRQAGELEKGTAYRDKEYKHGEHNLFTIGAGVKAYAESQGVPMTLERDYGLVFTEDGTPAGGEAAETISVTITYNKARKETVMEYDPSTGKYTYYQYGKMMADQITQEPEQFRNVVIMYTDITLNGPFHQANFVAGGTGYYACGGKIIPMTWTCADEDSAFQYWTMDGEPLYFGQGNSYIAVCTPESPVTYQAGTGETE